jgi:hypothetical protein
MSLKSVVFNRSAFAAYIGAAVGLIAAYVGYVIAERAYNLEHDKWLADLITTIAVRDTNTAQGTAKYLSRSKILKKDDEELICWLFLLKPPACPVKELPPRPWPQSN